MNTTVYWSIAYLEKYFDLKYSKNNSHIQQAVDQIHKGKQTKIK